MNLHLNLNLRGSIKRTDDNNRMGSILGDTATITLDKKKKTEHNYPCEENF